MDRYTLYGTFVSVNVTEFFKMKWEREEEKEEDSERSLNCGKNEKNKKRTKADGKKESEQGLSERQRGMKRQKKKKRKGTCFSRQEYFCHIVSIRHRNINLAFSSLSEGGKNKTRQKQIHAAKQKKIQGPEKFSAYPASLRLWCQLNS